MDNDDDNNNNNNKVIILQWDISLASVEYSTQNQAERKSTTTIPYFSARLAAVDQSASTAPTATRVTPPAMTAIFFRFIEVAVEGDTPLPTVDVNWNELFRGSINKVNNGCVLY